MLKSIVCFLESLLKMSAMEFDCYCEWSHTIFSAFLQIMYVCKLWGFFSPQLCVWCSPNAILNMFSIFTDCKCTKPACVTYDVCLRLVHSSVYRTAMEEETKSREESLLLRTCGMHGLYPCTIGECE